MNIGIANDLPMAVEHLRRILASSSKYKVIWTAKNGLEAVALCKTERPDLILMDLMMPVMNGVEASRSIMLKCPCPILIVSAHNDDSSEIFAAMSAGALDAIPVPTVSAKVEQFLAKIDALARSSEPDETEIPATPTATVRNEDHLVVIGSSAGGPAALAEILKVLPATFPVPIIIVQHLGLEFVPGLVSWLGSQTPLPVAIASEGNRPAPGQVLVAGNEQHLIFVSPGMLGYTNKPVDSIHRPSIDVFFKSVVQKWPGQATGVLLTGMGRDGAAGLKMMRNKGHLTITQDQASSVVYGMPKAAATMGAAAEILPLLKIGPRLKRIFSL